MVPDGSVRYATAVMGILSRHVPGWDADPVVVDFIERAVARQASCPVVSFEVIVDDPGRANWRLLGTADDRRRVHLHCFVPPPRRDRWKIEETVNSLLDGLQLEVPRG